MTEKEIKILLFDKGLKVADLATALSDQFNITKGSADTMLRDLIAGKEWYPKYVGWLKDNYGIVVEKPAWLRPVRERMKAA